ncbi:helix-turn-helix domain-containing protein [Neolewinella agarilytica]|uniref:Helix-turn-helix domain-containing protein n=1 Tax=Neolewinella agarilytica TaxID=478744 RepID=A0A1H9D3E7_9BACT|nr:helix-turn-helix domain-containing protein [Neolewinella agarilytica]SEQ08016.1 Helix-turn-helix domain-containing protein [Neolewinella agarilytica]
MSKSSPPRLYLDITEAMTPVLEMVAEMAAEKAHAEAMKSINLAKNEPVFYTREEVADKLKVTVQTLDKYRKDGIIKCIPIGTRVLIPDTELTRLANRME